MNTSSVDRRLIEKKLDRLRTYLEELEPVARMDVEHYRRETGVRRQAERSLELAIMAACDINNHLVTRLTGHAPADYHDSFLKLAELGILPEAFAESLAPAAGLRNRLQHEYNHIDDALVFEGIRRAAPDFNRYAGYVLEFLGG